MLAVVYWVNFFYKKSKTSLCGIERHYVNGYKLVNIISNTETLKSQRHVKDNFICIIKFLHSFVAFDVWIIKMTMSHHNDKKLNFMSSRSEMWSKLAINFHKLNHRLQNEFHLKFRIIDFRIFIYFRISPRSQSRSYVNIKLTHIMFCFIFLTSVAKNISINTLMFK